MSHPYLSHASDPLTHDREVLVFDIQAVQQSHYVTLQPLRSGKCSQLWRMSSDGRLHHKGSSFSKGISSKKCESKYEDIDQLYRLSLIGF